MHEICVQLSFTTMILFVSNSWQHFIMNTFVSSSFIAINKRSSLHRLISFNFCIKFPVFSFCCGNYFPTLTVHMNICMCEFSTAGLFVYFLINSELFILSMHSLTAREIFLLFNVYLSNLNHFCCRQSNAIIEHSN